MSLSSLAVDLLLYLALPVAVYVLALVALWRKGWLGPDRRFQLYGPMLMVKTKRGRDLLDRIARRFPRLVNAFGDLGIVLAYVGMVAIFATLLLGAYFESISAHTAKVPVSEDLALPGLNPIIPLGYGLLAIIVAVVLHELCHGVLARANQIRVKSLGVLFLVLPLGAFVEQEETDMTAATPRRRDRVAAAGVMANFALGVIFFLLMAALVGTSVQAKADGVGILAIIPGTPAANTSTNLGPSGLAAGDILTRVNGSATPSLSALASALDHARPGENVSVQWYSQATGGLVTATVTLSADAHFPSLFNATSEGVSEAKLAAQAFLGVEESGVTPTGMVGLLTLGVASPAAEQGANTSDPIALAALFVILPYEGDLPSSGTTESFYALHGPLGALGPGTGWALVDLLYWLVWMNLLVGIFNTLPAVPFDGGFLFRDAAGGLLRRLKPSWTAEKRDAALGAISTLLTTIVLALLVLVVISSSSL